MIKIYTKVDILSMEDFLCVQNYENKLSMKPLNYYKNFTIENGEIKQE